MALAGSVLVDNKVYLVFGSTWDWNNQVRTRLSVGDVINLNRIMVHAGHSNDILSVWVIEPIGCMDNTVDLNKAPYLLWRGHRNDWPKVDKEGNLKQCNTTNNQA